MIAPTLDTLVRQSCKNHEYAVLTDRYRFVWQVDHDH